MHHVPGTRTRRCSITVASQDQPGEGEAKNLFGFGALKSSWTDTKSPAMRPLS